MCGDDEQHVHDGPVLSRRDLMRGVGGTAALGLLSAEELGPRAALQVARTAAVDGALPLSMAMHIHSSFSEQTGSMESHLNQAKLNDVDVLWWTDHSERMLGVHYRKVVHFTSLTQEATDGPPWQWVRENTGSLTSASGGSIVSSPASPNDTVAAGSLSVKAQSTSAATAAVRYFAQSHSAGWNYQTTMYGLSLTLDVMPATIGAGGYLELQVRTSTHLARAGRPAGVYVLSYRFGGPGAPGSHSTQGITGIVNLAAPAGRWTTVTVTPTDDIAVLWPDLPTTDFGSSEIRLGAVSTGGLTQGYFDYLRFTRRYASGDLPLQAQEALVTRYASAYPTVTQRQGFEISQLLPHLNWFGGTVHLPDFGGGVLPKNWPAFCQQQVADAHGAGAVISYNHPFGYSAGNPLPVAQQDSTLRSVATTLLNNKAFGCDILEVGYVVRSGIDLVHHLGLWDVLSRNARFLTGNGTSDDHAGTNWKGFHNNWVTSVWAASKAEADLLKALRAGRSWCGSLSRFRGSLDLLVDGSAPMGSVTVSTVAQRQLRVMATGLPTGSTLQVVSGVVDYAGTGAPTPNTKVLKSYAASALASGAVTLGVDNSKASFVRTQVVTSAGVVAATSNPVWLLRSAPPGGIPPARAA